MPREGQPFIEIGGGNNENNEWRDHARCNDGTGSMTELFFSVNYVDIQSAKAFCRECPVRAECLDYALSNHESKGVWGGEQISNGRVVKSR